MPFAPTALGFSGGQREANAAGECHSPLRLLDFQAVNEGRMRRANAIRPYGSWIFNKRSPLSPGLPVSRSPLSPLSPSPPAPLFPCSLLPCSPAPKVPKSGIFHFPQPGYQVFLPDSALLCDYREQLLQFCG